MHTVRCVARRIVLNWCQIADLARESIHQTSRSCEEWRCLLVPSWYRRGVAIVVSAWKGLVVNVEAMRGSWRRHLPHLTIDIHIGPWTSLEQLKFAVRERRRTREVPVHLTESFPWLVEGGLDLSGSECCKECN